MITNPLWYYSWPLRRLGSRYTCLSRLSWGRWWRAGWLVLAWSIAILGLWGDQLHVWGWRGADLSLLTLASKVFPFQRDIAVGPATYFVLNRGRPMEALPHIRRGVAYDPWSAELALAQLTYASLLGRSDEATQAGRRLEFIRHGSR